MTTADKILKLIQASIDDFNAAIPTIQKQLYGDLVDELQLLQTRSGRILSNLDNLKLIGSIRNKLEKIILSDEYIKQVGNYVQAFELVTGLQNEYFREFNGKFTLDKTLKVVRQLAIDSTINSLTEAGIAANVLEPVGELLRTNITTGGKFSDLQEGLRSRILTQGDSLGGLERYTKQITTDALNQYNAQYHATVCRDLGYQWFRYTGSLLTTSREFCDYLLKKEWVHISELPDILKGHIDGHQCLIYPRTGLPYGMIPETTVDNFTVFRGGFNCGHQFFGVPTSDVNQSLAHKKF